MGVGYYLLGDKPWEKVSVDDFCAETQSKQRREPCGFHWKGEVTAGARGPAVGGPMRSSAGAGEVPGDVSMDCELIPCGRGQDSGLSLSGKGRHRDTLMEE